MAYPHGYGAAEHHQALDRLLNDLGEPRGSSETGAQIEAHIRSDGNARDTARQFAAALALHPAPERSIPRRPQLRLAQAAGAGF